MFALTGVTKKNVFLSVKKITSMKKYLFFFLFLFSFLAFGQKNIVNQVVDASCGLCQFDKKKDKSCSLYVKINQRIYSVEGTGIDDHGDAHASNGFCEMVRKANVSGEIRKGKFYATSFQLLPVVARDKK